jgi:hypothetical protein
MSEARRRVVMSGLSVAFVTLAAGLVNLLVTSRMLWIVVFAALCYVALRATRRESADPATQPWRAELIAAVVSLLGCLALAPFVPVGPAAYLLAAAWVLLAHLLIAWWLG